MWHITGAAAFGCFPEIVIDEVGGAAVTMEAGGFGFVVYRLGAQPHECE